MAIDQVGALDSPNQQYSKEYGPDLINLVADMTDDVIERSLVHQSAIADGNHLTQWFEAETMALPHMSPNTTLWNAVAQRLFLRRDIIYSGPEAGDVYQIVLEDGIYTTGYIPTSRKAILMYRPAAPDEDPVATQLYLPDPLAEIELIVPDKMNTDFAKIVNYDFLTYNRLTLAEITDLFDRLAFIGDAISHGDDSGTL